ncbi:MAG: S-methyl-5-thioribose-1-phosphate isomerase [Euryarchaeota archaeon RBG_16_68_12]|nr:MAG: S-methyl-5-thioribose-1-phosphate isomerase [Euryarchaeota archaeon RBG_16_68_12]
MRVRIDGATRELKTVWLEGDVVRMIDQRALPFDLRILDARDLEEVATAIEAMAVRGAPAIGAAAAYGLALAEARGMELERGATRLRRTRPTGHDLFAAIDFVLERVRAGVTAREAALAYAREDEERCLAIGRHGRRLIKPGMRILTHCNAGALAAVDHGTAMAPMRAARDAGVEFFVYVSETRPRLQGSRLTAWELQQEGIDHAIVVDSACGFLIQRGEVDLVLVGADRIAANGDTANKVGTYPKAVVAKANRVPFYVAAPLTTVDFGARSGRAIPIEERDESEVLLVDGTPVAPKGSHARNFAFDVTPARYVTGFVTDRGILTPAELRALRRKRR